jgi:hypothetical protein
MLFLSYKYTVCVISFIQFNFLYTNRGEVKGVAESWLPYIVSELKRLYAYYSG